MKSPLSFMAGRLASVFVFGGCLALLLGGCGKQETKNTGTDNDPALGSQPSGGGQNNANNGNLLGEKPAPKPTTPQPGTVDIKPIPPDSNPPPALFTPVGDPTELKEMPANAKYLPKDVVAVMSIEPGQLLKKADHAKLIKTEPVQELLKGLDNEMLTGLVTNPEESGLAMDQPMHLHVRVKELKNGDDKFPVPIMGLVGVVKDEAKLEKLLNTILQLTGAPVKITDAEKGGYRQIVVPGAPVALGFSKDTIIVAGVASLPANEGDFPEEAPGFPDDERKDSADDPGDSDKCDEEEGVPMPDSSHLLAEAFGVKESLATDERFKTHLRSDYDLAAWVNYESIMKLVGNVMGDELEGLGLEIDGLVDKFTKDNVHSVRLRFNAGTAELAWLAYHDEKILGDASGSGMPKDMLDILPQGTIGVITESVNMAEMLKVFNEALKPLLGGPEGEMITTLIEENLGMTLDELLSIPKGDFLLAFTGLKMQVVEDADPMPMPQFILGLSVANQDNLGKLQGALARHNALMMMNMVGIQIVNKKGRFYICSQDHVPAINAGQATQKIGANTRTTLEKNDFAGILRFAPISAMIQQFAEGDPDVDMIISVLNEFKQASMAGGFGKGRQDMIARLDFKDPKTNGLRQLVDIIRRVAQEVDFGNFGGDDAADEGIVNEGIVVPPEIPGPPTLKQKEGVKRDK